VWEVVFGSELELSLRKRAGKVDESRILYDIFCPRKKIGTQPELFEKLLFWPASEILFGETISMIPSC